MIVISGNVRYETSIEKSGLPLRYRGLQEFDITNSVQNMTKYCVYLTEPNAVKYEVQKAVSIAMGGRRGPVWIDVPQDIQNSMIEEENLVGYIDDESENLFDASAADKAIEILKKCKRPCILMGSGIQTTQSEDLFEEMLNKITIPVVGGAWLGDIFYLEHPLYYGLSGNAGPRTGNFILQNSDCILAIGNSLSYKQTGYDLASFAPNAKK